MIADAQPAAPIVLLTSGGEDAAPVLQHLAAQRAAQLAVVALGSGQAEAAAAALQRAALSGDWLLLKLGAGCISRILENTCYLA